MLLPQFSGVVVAPSNHAHPNELHGPVGHPIFQFKEAGFHIGLQHLAAGIDREQRRLAPQLGDQDRLDAHQHADAALDHLLHGIADGLQQAVAEEDADEEKAAEICYLNYGVTFTMLSPTAVTGDKANALFKALAEQSEQPKWNFNKYLLGKDGKVIEHFGSMTKPDSAKLAAAIDKAL